MRELPEEEMDEAYDDWLFDKQPEQGEKTRGRDIFKAGVVWERKRFASFLETARKGFIEIIGDMVNDLNLPENYSLKGEKKSCCQAQLMVLKHKIIAVFGGKEKKGDGEE